MTLQQAVKIFRTEVLKSLILKIQIEHIIPFSTRCQQLLNAVIEHI